MLAGFMGMLFLAWLLFAPGGGLVSYLKAKRELAGIRQQSMELEKSNALLRQMIFSNASRFFSGSPSSSTYVM